MRDSGSTGARSWAACGMNTCAEVGTRVMEDATASADVRSEVGIEMCGRPEAKGMGGGGRGNEAMDGF